MTGLQERGRTGKQERFILKPGPWCRGWKVWRPESRFPRHYSTSLWYDVVWAIPWCHRGHHPCVARQTWTRMPLSIRDRERSLASYPLSLSISDSACHFLHHAGTNTNTWLHYSWFMDFLTVLGEYLLVWLDFIYPYSNQKVFQNRSFEGCSN